MAYDPGTMGTNWRGRDRAAILNDRYARQNARTQAQQQPPAQQPPAQAPPGANNLPPVTQPAPADPWVDWMPRPGNEIDPYMRMGWDPAWGDEAEYYANAQRQKATGDYGQRPGAIDMQNMEQMLMQILGGGQMGGQPGIFGGGPGNDMGMMMPPGGGYGGPSGIGGGGIDDPIQTYLSTVPVMQNMMNRNISGAMGQAGLTGSRFSSGAQDTAARIGGETSLQQNQMLNDLLYRHTQEDLNRGLESSIASLGFGAQDLDRGAQSASALGQLGLGMSQDQQNRLNSLGQWGGWEQGRQDDFSKMRYEDFINSRMGYLPMLFNFLGGMGQAPGQSQGYQINQGGGQTGLMDILPLLLSMFSGGD